MIDIAIAFLLLYLVLGLLWLNYAAQMRREVIRAMHLSYNTSTSPEMSWSTIGKVLILWPSYLYDCIKTQGSLRG